MTYRESTGAAWAVMTGGRSLAMTILAFAIGFPIVFYLCLLGVLVVESGHLPNYITPYDWLANVLRIIHAHAIGGRHGARSFSTSGCSKSATSNYHYGHGVAEWSLSIIPHKLVIMSLAGALVGLNVSCCSSGNRREALPAAVRAGVPVQSDGRRRAVRRHDQRDRVLCSVLRGTDLGRRPRCSASRPRSRSRWCRSARSLRLLGIARARRLGAVDRSRQRRRARAFATHIAARSAAMLSSVAITTARAQHGRSRATRDARASNRAWSRSIASRSSSAAVGKAHKAVEETSTRVAPGEFVCILGPSGCGKSTLLNASPAMSSPHSGQVSVDGETVTRPGPDRGMVFQQYSLFPWKTVMDNVAFGPRVAGQQPQRGDRAHISRHGGPDALRQPLSRRIVGRHAAAGRHRPRARQLPARPLDGRAVRRARRADPADDAGKPARTSGANSAPPCCSSRTISTRRSFSPTAC